MGSTIGTGAAVVGEMLRFRPWRRGPAAPLIVCLLAAGFAGSVVLAGQRAEKDPGVPAAGVALPRPPGPVSQETASLLPQPAPAWRDSVEVTAPADPVASLAPPSPPTAARRAASVPPTSVPPSSVAPSAGHPDVHAWVAPSAPLGASPPTRVDIGAVGLTAPIGPLGLNRDGTLQVPTDFSRAGWYTGRPTPGETGPAIIVAHRSSRHGPGAFWTLPDVRPGQEIVVTRADRRRILFAIDRVEQHRKDAFPTDAVYGPTPQTALRLITCGGPFEPALGDHYRDNVIVFAHMTGWAP